MHAVTSRAGSSTKNIQYKSEQIIKHQKHTGQSTHQTTLANRPAVPDSSEVAFKVTDALLERCSSSSQLNGLVISVSEYLVSERQNPNSESGRERI